MPVTRTAKVRDMTQGNPLPLILHFAIPLFIGNIFQQAYNMVDTMVVGHHLGDAAIAAIGATSSLFSLIVNFAGGLNNGYSYIVTQQFGAHNKKAMKQAVAGMILLDLVISLVISIAAVSCLPWLMRFMNTPQALFSQSYAYISVIYSGLVCTVSYNMFAAILRAMGNSRTPLYFLILASCLNIALDVLFVIVFAWGVGGAAVATVLAQATAAVSCGVYTFRNYREYLPEKADFRVPGSMLRNLLASGLSAALVSCLVDFGSVIFQRANNVLGQAIIAAHAASRKLLSLMIQPQATLALAMSTFAGQNWGAGQFDRIRSTLKKVLALELLWGVCATTAIYLLGAQLVQLTTGTRDPEIIRNAVLSLRVHFSTFPILGILFCMRFTMQSMGQKIAPVLSSSIELSMKIFSAAVLIPRLGFLGTCMTEPITWVLMATFLLLSFRYKHRALFRRETA